MTNVFHYATSLGPEQITAAELAGVIRDHWGIENRLHWLRDMVFDEDRHATRLETVPRLWGAAPLGRDQSPPSRRKRRHRRIKRLLPPSGKSIRPAQITERKRTDRPCHRPAHCPFAPSLHARPVTSNDPHVFSTAAAAPLAVFATSGLVGAVFPTAILSGGHRAYAEDDLGWLDLVHCMRDTGMPIADLKLYAELSLDEATLAARVALLEEHDRRVQESIDGLRRQQERLREKIGWYREQGV